MEKKLHLHMGFDRISGLPDPIKAHILSQLPTIDAVKTSILSNTWRAMWTQIHTLDLSRNKLPNLLTYSYSFYTYVNDSTKVSKETIIRTRELFYEFLDRAFESISMLEKLKLYVPGVGSDSKFRLDTWIERGFGFRQLIEFNFELGYESSENFRYCLPNCVFSSNLIRKLTLVNCEVGSSSLTDIHLPLLCDLCLVHVYLNGEAMSSLISNCPNLEDLNFDTCNGLESLEISGLLKLKKARIKYAYENPLAIEIEAPSLLEFTYECENFCDNEGFCEIELVDCLNVKRFTAIGTALDDYDLHYLLRRLPSLERLELYHCDCLRNIEFSSPKLVHLEFVHCGWLRKAQVNAPNLKVFHYEDDEPITLPLRGTTPRLNEAFVYLKPDNKNDKYYAVLVQFFAKLRHCERLILCVGSEEDLIVSEKVRMKTRPPLSGVKHLMVKLRVPFKKHTPVSFVEGLLWLAPCPETISISNSCIPVLKSLEFVYEKPLKSQTKCGCWKSLTINCWRHSLNKVTIENKKGAEDDTRLANFLRNARIDGKIVDCSYKSFGPNQRRTEVHDGTISF
ncbi:hypothetical protein RND81_09G099700 [Saponaria officinalis]|uniref:F-box domain-containing protein n=1 Tax=Saponaria officinalis TaxID=3572 RepID=A0AAW1IKY9_SAPOF